MDTESSAHLGLGSTVQYWNGAELGGVGDRKRVIQDRRRLT